jgi:hypothetical protein
MGSGGEVNTPLPPWRGVKETRMGIVSKICGLSVLAVLANEM